jgi:hypothetical protein
MNGALHQNQFRKSQSFARIDKGIVIFHCVQRGIGRHAFVRSSLMTATVAMINCD